MHDSNPHQHPAVALARQVIEAIRDGELDQAEALLEELRPLVRNQDDLMVFLVLIDIQRGQVEEAYHGLCALGEDQALELKALCLNIMGDPSWHGLATQALEGTDLHTRRAMQQLCGLPVESLPEDGGSPRTVVQDGLPYAAVFIR